MLDLAIERFDLRAYVVDHGASQIQEHEYVLPCPSCGKDKLVVNLQRRAWHCWVCQRFEIVMTVAGPKRRSVAGAGGLIDLIQLLERCDRKRAVQLVLVAGITAADLSCLTMREFCELGGELSSPLRPVAPPPDWRPITYELPYLRYRGISMDDVQRLGLFWVAGGRYAQRLVFPVWQDGALVYWQARAMWQPAPGEQYVKALNPPRTPGAAGSSDVLFGLHAARYYPRVCVTEGPVDAIHAGSDAVCSFGKMLHPRQIWLLYQAGVTAIDLMYDADAKKDMEALAPLLASLFDVRLVFLPHGDPGSWDRAALHHLRSYAVPVRPPSRLGGL